MIYIPLDGLSPDEKWLDKASELTFFLANIDDKDEKIKFINDNRREWGKLKAQLLELSHGKCWYSEARELVSFIDVDHFRPKNRAKNLNGDEREGYWWLAFDWKNYRIAGEIINRSGKGDYFPLQDGCNAVCDPDADLNDEVFYFLDPTDPDDPPLMSFDETGFPIPAAIDDSWISERVRVTTRLLRLNHPALVDERKKVWIKCRSKIFEAEKVLGNPMGSATKKSHLRGIFSELREMISPRAELSATARACLLKSGHDWAGRLAMSA